MQADPAPAGSFRLVTWNVRSLRDDRRLVSTSLRALRPDVVCVQEAPRFLRRRSSCARLARESGLLVIGGGGPSGATLLLASVRVRVLETREVLLSATRGLHRRGAALAVLEVGGRRVAVASVHLGVDPAERARHVPELLGHVEALAAPAVVAGDLNDVPGSPTWTALTGRFPDASGGGGAPTFPARLPDRCLDAVLVDPRIAVGRCEVPGIDGLERASDHRPVLAVLTLPVAD